MSEEGQNPAAPPPAGPRNSNSSGGRRRPGRGAAHHSDRSENRRDDGSIDGPPRGPRGRGGGGGGGGGRGGGGRGGRDRQRNRSQKPKAQASNATSGGGGQPPGTVPDGPGTSGDRSTGDAKGTESDAKGKLVATATDEPDDGEICFICASKVEHTSVAPCNHRTCHICALRLRALYKTKACAHCRTESSFVIFTDDPAKRYEEFTPAELVRTDDNLGIKYEREEIFEDTVILLRYNCPDKDCDVACLGWPDLHRHVKSKHGKVMCDLCTRNKKVFTHEHELFTTSQLRKHEKYGDDNPGDANQSGFRGHPECGFCRIRFYGDDELYAHCRDKHERCHICDRRSGNRQQQYYIDYDALEDHFQREHFLCLDKECLEKKFVVFETQMDLQAHQLEVHPHGLSKDARRDARTVDMSTFDYRTPYQPQRQRRGAGRGRDPNAEPLPISSAQPLRRDELAYQRQLAIQSAQSVTTRSFGGQLTPSDTQSVRVPARAAGPTPAQAAAAAARTPPVSAMENLSISTENGPLTPQEQARRLRHAAVIERASNLLQNDQLKISEFRTKVSNYRTSAISATDLIDAFFSLFDAPSSELGKLIKELAEIYEDESKKNGLLKAWNDWRAINEDYPALPGPSGVLPGLSSNTAGAGGKRVLRLKSSTAQSSRSAVGRSGALPGSLSSGNFFPPLSSSSSSAARTAASAPVWGTGNPASRPPAATSSTSTPSRAAPRTAAPNANDTEAFPALPAAPKPNTLMAGLTRGTVRWNERAPAVNAWGTGNASSSSSAAAASASGDEPENGDLGPATGKKGKGKKGKQTLFHFG
ncbi:hypothetical protein VTN77DRAFT_8096 [Rasamsonia byssochlamydoides]|uniref:uncharacterized protein n=1 Tax=Rasamsonia byssochlamydoides TaxID=89139 RepID=UPI0037424EFB